MAGALTDPDRCGEPRNDEIVIMRVHRAKLEGLENSPRSSGGRANVTPSSTVASTATGSPRTTEGPMIVSADRTLGRGPELPELPLLHKLRLEGASGPFEVDFYRAS
jgi:hypothetical protein